MRSSKNDTQSTSTQNPIKNETKKVGQQKKEMNGKVEYVNEILDARFFDNQLEFLCSIRDRSEPLWVSREDCKAGNLIQDFFNHRARQVLLEDEESRLKVEQQEDADEPSTSTDKTTTSNKVCLIRKLINLFNINIFIAF